MSKAKKWAPHGVSTRNPNWRPKNFSPRIGDIKTKEKIGLGILSALSVTSVWSSVAPSFFTLATFASRPEARERALKTIWIAFGLSTATAAAIYFVFDELIPAVIAEGMAAALWGISMHAINSPAPETVAPMERQPEAQPLSQAILEPSGL